MSQIKLRVRTERKYIFVTVSISEVALWWNISSHEKQFPLPKNPGDKKSPKIPNPWDWAKIPREKPPHLKKFPIPRIKIPRL